MRKAKIAADNYYHIFNRGVNYGLIFFNPGNWLYFMNLIRNYFKPSIVEIVTYCLMPNHYHLLVLVNSDEFSNKVMQPLSVSYTKSINNQQRRVGSLFQGTYQSRLINQDSYLLQLTKYIHLNPVKAGFVPRCQDWEFSSYKDYIGLRSDKFLKPEIILSQFSSQSDYEDFVYSEVEIKLPEGLLMDNTRKYF